MSEKYEIPTLYVVVQFGEVHSWSFTEKGALLSAQESVSQTINDHWRHKLPVQVTPDIARDMDVRVYRCDQRSQVELPFQEWFDSFYQDGLDSAKADEEREYERYLELRTKYESKYQQELADQLRPAFTTPRNCS